MKTATVQGCCCLALALMTGAVGAHWASVRQTVTLAAMLQARPAATAAPVAPSPLEDPVEREARQILAEAKSAGHQEVTAPGTPVASSEVDARFERAVAAFEQLVAQNADLKNQVAETNRDLMALQFQVDSHSESFRPLKVAEEPVPMPSNGVLPPKEAP